MADVDNGTNVIKWDNAGPDDILWEYDHEYIRTATLLVVTDWQWAVFVRDGQIISVFESGKHTLTTANWPILTKIYEKALGYKEGAFKAKVIFISKKQFLGKWGVRAMCKVAEDYQAPVPLMANGEYQFRINDPAVFITQMVGGMKTYATGAVMNFMKSFINEQITQELSKQYFMDVYSGLEKASMTTKVNIEDEFKNRGVEMLALRINGVQTEDKYQEDIYKFQQFRASGGRDWKQFGVMEHMADAIGTSSGGAAIGTGMLLFPQMYQQLSQQQQQAAMQQMQQQGASAQNPKIMCPFCGGVNDYPYKFCKNCGKQAPGQEPQAAAAPVAAAPAAQPAAQPATAAPAAAPGTAKKFNRCPYCGEDISALPKTPKYCPYCSEQLM
jgi:membrane protease subunit (stomatin/prohibitin family)